MSDGKFNVGIATERENGDMEIAIEPGGRSWSEAVHRARMLMALPAFSWAAPVEMTDRKTTEKQKKPEYQWWSILPRVIDKHCGCQSCQTHPLEERAQASRPHKAIITNIVS